ncbi:MAG: methyltransferase domain-containing protein [Bacteriovoracia bacterium]
MKTFCGYFNEGICRSCDLITMDYPAQIKVKEEKLSDALKDSEHPPLLPTVVSPPTHFRNKAKLVVTGTAANPVIGLWGTENLDSGRELLNCPLHLERINQIFPSLKNFITLANLSPYNISEKKGELKGLILFHSETTNETYLRFILRSKESIDRIKKHQEVLLRRHPDIKTISVNIQPVPHAILEGEEEIFITQKKSVQHKAGEVVFSIRPQGFVQTNQLVAEKLYQTAATWVQEEGLKNFMELFCGQGAFSFFAAPVISWGLGIEINPQAVEEASEICKNSGISHLSFKCLDAGKTGEEIKSFQPDVILVNPPRRGIAEAADLLLEAKAKAVIYSSCNYLSLKEDLKKLSKIYRVEKVQIFDMFPHTSHFETLVLLKLNGAG